MGPPSRAGFWNVFDSLVVIVENIPTYVYKIGMLAPCSWDWSKYIYAFVSKTFSTSYFSEASFSGTSFRSTCVNFKRKEIHRITVTNPYQSLNPNICIVCYSTLPAIVFTHWVVFISTFHAQPSYARIPFLWSTSNVFHYTGTATVIYLLQFHGKFLVVSRLKSDYHEWSKVKGI